MMDAADPRHGTQAGRMQHWRDSETPCAACREAGHKLDKAIRVDRDRNRPRTVPLGRTALDIIASQSRTQVSAATGISVQKLSEFLRLGPTTRVHRATRDKIHAASRAQMIYTPIGISRRLQALTFLGWSSTDISQACGLHIDGMKRLRARDPKFVRHEVALRVVSAYADMHMHLPGHPSPQARGLAARRQWAPPLAWDDIDHDETPRGLGRETPRTNDDVDPVRVDRLLDLERIPDATRDERREAMRRWLQDGKSERSLCAVHGWKDGRYKPVDGAA